MACSENDLRHCQNALRHHALTGNDKGMTLSPKDRMKQADLELAQAEAAFKAVQDGRAKLNAIVVQRQQDYDAALQDWSHDKSDKAITRLTTTRAQLNAVRELLQEDTLPYAKAEAELERSRRFVTEVECVRQAVELANDLQRQQDYFTDDFQELQRHVVELLDKLRKTADAWDSMHQRQYEIAREADLTPDQLQRRVEAWGFDAQPLKRVLVRSPLDDNSTLAYRHVYKLPDAVDGSDLAQYAKRLVTQGLLDHYNDKARSQQRQGLSHAQSRPTLSSAEEEALEARELARHQRVMAEQAKRQTTEARAWEQENDARHGAREPVQQLHTITRTQAERGELE